MSRTTCRRLLWGTYVFMVLLTLYSIPWFDSEALPPPIVFGLPLWVARAVFCLLFFGLLNVVAWYLQSQLVSEGSHNE